ncbi:MAG: zinc-ribbon domain-containing protein, partial [Clostridiales bacterium]|nr:zinc-ribbon domain-containing protein [Clostridiales bacterium]
MKQCPKCGQYNGDNSHYCQMCGTPLDVQQNQYNYNQNTYYQPPNENNAQPQEQNHSEYNIPQKKKKFDIVKLSWICTAIFA